jgi:type IV pilus assembly protein PilM
MLGFVQNFFAPRANPIGVDFGSDCLRLAQVQVVDGEHRLLAAATADVPTHVRHDPSARLAFFVEATRDLLAQGGFRGRSAVLSLPAASMFIQHLRLPRTDDATLRKTLPFEARGKLPIDPSQALLRHLVAGEIYHDHDPKQEVIVMAASRELVNQFLAMAAKARLDVVGMNVEPRALVDCFQHVYRRKTDADVTNCFVDIGCCGTRAVIARGGQILFARSIPIGGDHFNRAVATALGIGVDDAKLLRIKLCTLQPNLDENRDKHNIAEGAGSPPSADNSFALLNLAERRSNEIPTAPPPETAPAEAAPAPADAVSQARAVEQACRDTVNKLAEELDMCRRYHEATFPNMPVNRLIFVGGEARHRSLCQHIARQLGLAAQVGDPLVRMGRISEVGIESGIDRRQPQPSWAVAIGLSMGPKVMSEKRVEARA